MSYDKATYMKEYNKKYYGKNKEKIAAYGKKYREKNRERVLAYKKEWNKKRLVQLRYGISPEEVAAMLKEQDNKCKICLIKFNKAIWKYKVNIDHCHKTNKVRGLLCNLCNRGLGFFKDSKENLTNAINYLEEAA